ncbi:30S ribosomal subunit protein S15 [Candidatus Xenohaliotis californiensis]|uniref:Small ribosomal subunit protein uS15 n=1 Tax=Candidatus Xenohaliotis californiensis TaxID=84677 RepID=A0ABM9N941_9RICK|nr:30S ribosomal subunit protein S15 [Candidatus Xenohaliotis californiensis]
MSITIEQKSALIKQHQSSKNDTGSVNVQCAILTTRINNLIQHFKIHKKDHHSRRGLILLVEKRRRLLKYLKQKNINEYATLIQKLNIRK